MAYFTSNTYSLKRKILTFTNKISKHLSKPEKNLPLTSPMAFWFLEAAC